MRFRKVPQDDDDGRRTPTVGDVERWRRRASAARTGTNKISRLVLSPSCTTGRDVTHTKRARCSRGIINQPRALRAVPPDRDGDEETSEF